MTNEEATRVLLNEYRYNAQRGVRCCGKTNLTTALLMGISALRVIEQYKWERDVAISQLEELGLSLGQKIEGVYLTKEEHEKLLEYKWMYEELTT